MLTYADVCGRQIPKSFGSMRSLDVLEIAGLALTMPPKVLSLLALLKASQLLAA
jgi:hypothetical protein